MRCLATKTQKTATGMAIREKDIRVALASGPKINLPPHKIMLLPLQAWYTRRCLCLAMAMAGGVGRVQAAALFFQSRFPFLFGSTRCPPLLSSSRRRTSHHIPREVDWIGRRRMPLASHHGCAVGGVFQVLAVEAINQ